MRARPAAALGMSQPRQPPTLPTPPHCPCRTRCCSLSRAARKTAPAGRQSSAAALPRCCAAASARPQPHSCAASRCPMRAWCWVVWAPWRRTCASCWRWRAATRRGRSAEATPAQRRRCITTCCTPRRGSRRGWHSGTSCGATGSLPCTVRVGAACPPACLPCPASPPAWPLPAAHGWPFRIDRFGVLRREGGATPALVHRYNAWRGSRGLYRAMYPWLGRGLYYHGPGARANSVVAHMHGLCELCGPREAPAAATSEAVA